MRGGCGRSAAPVRFPAVFTPKPLHFPVPDRLPMPVPAKPELRGLEEKWSARWDADGTYRFDRGREREGIYAIDTPPPTVSGALHVGHVFSYTHIDVIARFQRMLGKMPFFPMGWDDNGLPTERRVQNYYGVRCDPSLPYDPGFTPPESPPKQPVSVSRRNFIELCGVLTHEDEQAFERLWRTLGLSVDWSMTYATIGERARRASQRAFLRMLARGEAYQVEAPTLWDVDFRTAVAQAELEDREVDAAYHRVRFHGGEGPVEIETTRPELLPACVAMVAHPDDARYQPLFGTTATTPLFGARVPILPHPAAEPEKGTGIAMVCTFGDTTDVTWWRELGLPVRGLLRPDGTFRPVAWGEGLFESADLAKAQAAYDQLAGKAAKGARAAIVELLRESGELVGEPRPIKHAVKFYEKGDRPVEILTSRQWFVRTTDQKEALLRRGAELRWHPAYMRSRFENWVNGVNQDWCISRQRFFGVAFPVWYPMDADGNVRHDQPILAPEERLPVDPSSDVPDGYTAEQRGQPGGFVGDPDVMDTWATSSLSPQIAAGWEEDPELFARVFPMDLRPQAHDIIRTWLFSTVLRSHQEHGTLPWSDTLISGWVLDPDRKKMSKSKGNVVTPIGLLEEHGSDAVRYWAASGRPGADTAFDPGQMKIGRKLATKLLNASRFVLSGETEPGAVTAPLDRAVLARVARIADEATAELHRYDYTRALERAEVFFWWYCDNYLELVKGRRYGEAGAEGAASAAGALTASLDVLLRLFAPFLPFVTEEVWSWWREGSIHAARWPSGDEVRALGGDGDERVLEVAAELLGEIRKAKSAAQQSLGSEVGRVRLHDTPERLELARSVEQDVLAAARASGIDYLPADDFRVEVEMAPPPAAVTATD
jgi:valyl-tRNA synthetase